jgi:D-psicose/D-tagatose/L-ribulose 3-epimerase
MKLQRFEGKNRQVAERFRRLKVEHPERLERRLVLSWSNWGFGMEELVDSVKRLARNDIRFVELHGNRYGADMGYRTAETRRVLDGEGVRVAGVCGIFSPDCDLASNRGPIRQYAIDYIRRNVALAHELGGTYFLLIPGAVGRTQKIDDSEIPRAVETLRRVADVLVETGVRGAVEPVRAAEVSVCHTVAEVLRFIDALDHPGVQHINGDTYHMQVGEAHIGEAVLEAGARMINLHLSDSNRCALGDGSLDLDTLIMALYLIGFNRDGCFVTPEPLGPGGDPYPAMHGRPDPRVLDELVGKTATYFREREDEVRAL